MSEFLRRNLPERADAPEIVVPDVVGDELPALVEFLSRTRWLEGDHREKGTILICWAEGRYRAWLHDRDGERSAWLSDPGLDGLLRAVDAGLRNDSLEWRRAVSRRGGSRPK